LDVISRGQQIPLSLKAGEQKVLNKHPLPKQAGAYSINGETRVLRRFGWGVRIFRQENLLFCSLRSPFVD